MVEIDRGTMPVVRADLEQTSFERKMRAYLTAHAARQHQTRFGWNTFRVLTATTDEFRMKSMIDALRRIHVTHSPGASLFLFTTQAELHGSDPLGRVWHDANGRQLSPMLT